MTMQWQANSTIFYHNYHESFLDLYNSGFIIWYCFIWAHAMTSKLVVLCFFFLIGAPFSEHFTAFPVCHTYWRACQAPAYLYTLDGRHQNVKIQLSITSMALTFPLHIVVVSRTFPKVQWRSLINVLSLQPEERIFRSSYDIEQFTENWMHCLVSGMQCNLVAQQVCCFVSFG